MLSCTVNPSAWAASNQVALFPGELQEWTWVTRAALDKSASELGDEAKTRTAYVFANAGGLSSAADSFTVKRVARTPPTISASHQRREQLNPLPLLASGSGELVWVTLSFALRTTVTRAPWPVYSSLWDTGSSHCPTAALWMLDSAGGKAAGEAPPEPPPFPWNFGEGGAATPVSQAVSALERVAWLAAAGVGLYAVGQGLGLAKAVNRRKVRG